jgi:hypothetical protein
VSGAQDKRGKGGAKTKAGNGAKAGNGTSSVGKEDPTALPPGAADDEQLTPEVKAAFAMIVTRLEKRRKINLAAYLLALVTMIVGLVGGILFMAAAPHTFRGWIFFVPFAIIGVIFWVFGRWAKRA